MKLCQSATACIFVMTSCQVTSLESEAGQHVIVHWDPDENQLCGGTLAHVDASLEVMARTYGVDLPSAPYVNILWTSNRSLAESACRGNSLGCNVYLPNGTDAMIIDDVAHSHELTHAVNLSGTKKFGLPSFFAEGVATRWEPGLSDAWPGRASYIGDVTHADVLALLARLQIPPDAYNMAGFLWSWLEAEFGPATMAEFASRLDIFSSPEKIEREFEATFGITLKAATDASRGGPWIAFDSAPCLMTHLPTLVWAEEPLLLSPGRSTCAANDVVNSHDQAARYARLELPDTWRDYTLELTGPMSAVAIHFYACRGEPLPYEDPIVLTPKGSDWSMGLTGTYIVILTAPLEESGHVPFPTARLKP